ncbi:hypothetical protein [Pectobacterium versatile]|uniref:hypothetical protein n=1 Tax=Pectobacterium versatile TaxID=2488639 RepID=UPI001F304225|nr:hypothetical protein [Pectobacterium versatile]
MQNNTITIIKKHFKNKEKFIDIDRVSTRSEKFFGKEFTTVIMHKNGLGKEKSKNDKPYISIIENESGIAHSSRKIYVRQLINKKIFNIYAIPFLLILFLICLGYYSVVFFAVLSYLLPMLFGYMIYAMTYDQMGDYLKKIADFVVIFTGAIGATALILEFIDINILKGNFFITGIITFVQAKINYLTAFRVLAVEIFIFFYTIKLLISFTELRVARRDWLSKGTINSIFVKNPPKKMLRSKLKVAIKTTTYKIVILYLEVKHKFFQ